MEHIAALTSRLALYGVLPLDFKEVYSVGDLLTQHLDELEQKALPAALPAATSDVDREDAVAAARTVVSTRAPYLRWRRN